MTKNKKIIIGIVVSVLFFTGVLIVWQNYRKPIVKKHLEKSRKFCGWSTYAKCKADTDCNIGGCSGQVCEGKGKGTITNCRARECYRVPGYKCKCSNNKCQWLKIK